MMTGPNASSSAGGAKVSLFSTPYGKNRDVAGAIGIVVISEVTGVTMMVVKQVSVSYVYFSLIAATL